MFAELVPESVPTVRPQSSQRDLLRTRGSHNWRENWQMERVELKYHVNCTHILTSFSRPQGRIEVLSENITSTSMLVNKIK